MMDIDARHSLLRAKLNNLGFTQPLPIGSLAIVSALLDDLVLTNKQLKDAKKTIATLEKVTLIGSAHISTFSDKSFTIILTGENGMESRRRTVQM